MPIPYQLFLFLNIIRYLLHLLQVVGLTVDRLNTIRTFVRTYFDGKPGVLILAVKYNTINGPTLKPREWT